VDALRFLPEVEEDALAAYTWYEGKARGLGDEFLRAFYACANKVLRSPLISPKVHQEFWRRLLRRFPYALYFTVKSGEILVIGLFHCARDPLGINAELSQRGGIEAPWLDAFSPISGSPFVLFVVLLFSLSLRPLRLCGDPPYIGY
jgi:hypothetical protein